MSLLGLIILPAIAAVAGMAGQALAGYAVLGLFLRRGRLV